VLIERRLIKSEQSEEEKTKIEFSERILKEAERMTSDLEYRIKKRREKKLMSLKTLVSWMTERLKS
jgi:hypothetical protein